MLLYVLLFHTITIRNLEEISDAPDLILRISALEHVCAQCQGSFVYVPMVTIPLCSVRSESGSMGAGRHAVPVVEVWVQVRCRVGGGRWVWVFSFRLQTQDWQPRPRSK